MVRELNVAAIWSWLLPMADLSKLPENRSTSALFKRSEQLRRWEESETNRERGTLDHKPAKLKFTDDCIFLAACSAGDKDEVQRLLIKGANINTGNVDGLTALHQACIDDNLDMVEFLVENGADVNCGDNEGWTPLHATASCGFVSIAKYLIENGANVAAVNNDGELPLDIAESDDMEEFLQQEIARQEIDCEVARNLEEHMMLEDANRMLNGKDLDDQKHPKTGATAMHVAAAKGYVKVLSIYISLGMDINAQDFDGWTPLHAAAHWGQHESCTLLVEAFCDMDIKNFSGQTALDIADADVVSLLEELKDKQIAMRENEKEKPEIQSILDKMHPGMKRRSSVTRMSVADKTNAVNKDKNQERVQIETTILQDSDQKSPINSSYSESEESEDESKEDSEVEKKNRANKVDSVRDIITPQEQVVSTQPRNRVPPPPAPAPVPKQPEENEDLPSWRRAARKAAPSTNANEIVNQKDTEEVKEEVILRTNSTKPSNDKDLEPRRRPISLDTSRDDRARQHDRRHTWFSENSMLGPSSFSPPRYPLTSVKSIIESYQAKVTNLRPVDQQSRKEPASPSDAQLTLATAVPSVTVMLPSATTVTASVSNANITSPTTPTTPSTTANMQIRRSFVPPVRDEESETQRKAHAKRVRETRRSTQGVTLEDLKSAEQLVQKKNSAAEEQKSASDSEKVTEPVPNNRLEDSMENRTVPNSERRSSWRAQAALDDKTMDDIQSAVRRSRESASDPSITATVTLLTTTPSATTAYTCRSRPQSANVSTDVDTTVTVTLKPRSSSLTQNEEDDLKDQDKENENKLLNSQATQAAIQRRRRPKRRSTGVVFLDLDGTELGDKKDESNDRVVDHTDHKEEAEEQQAIGDRGYRSSKYGSTSSLSESGSRAETPSRLTDRSDRTSRGSSVGSTASINNTGEKDYKKLYEEERSENERLREKLERSHQDLSEVRSQLEKALQGNVRNVTTDAERRERRALERKLSELEEELKVLEQLKTENQRLRDENGALIRVISKLSK